MPHCDRRNAAFFHRTIGVDLFRKQEKNHDPNQDPRPHRGRTDGSRRHRLELPQGGSVCIGMLPIFLYCARWGCKESFLASFAYGLLQLIFDGAYAWGPTSMLFDYVLAYGVLGVACLFRKQKGGVYIGTVVGCLCRFLVHFISGITIYRIYEPTELFNTTFANPYIYSAAYNGSYMVIDLVLCLVITALLYRPLSRYFAPQETVAAVKRNQGPEL